MGATWGGWDEFSGVQTWLPCLQIWVKLNSLRPSQIRVGPKKNSNFIYLFFFCIIQNKIKFKDLNKSILYQIYTK